MKAYVSILKSKTMHNIDFLGLRLFSFKHVKGIPIIIPECLCGVYDVIKSP